MLPWRIKGVIQGALAAVPGGVATNDLLQLTIGRRRSLDGYVTEKVGNWSTLTRLLQRSGGPPPAGQWVEIGTGWLPVLPVCFGLLHEGRTISFDLNRHLHRSGTRRLPALLERQVPLIALASGAEPRVVEAALAGLGRARNADEVLAEARIDYRAPSDFTRSGLLPESVDVVYSNSVLEHLPLETLDAVFAESRRVLKTGGRMVHGVACGDHYADFDRSITRINYLRYTEAGWRRWNNPILFQNRLRPVDFLAAAERHGFTVAEAQADPRPELLSAISEMPIAPEFTRYPVEQLCTTSVNFVARKR